MSEGPWIRFFPSDWLAGTRGMTAAETGIYITLIAMMYERGEPIPNDTRRLARLCGTTTASFTKALDRFITEQRIVVIEPGLWSPAIDKWRAMAGRENISPRVRRLVFDRDGNSCRYCGSTDGPFHIDHVYPVSKGGTNDPSNLCVACVPCNLGKGARLLSEWQQ